jgi:hypothetical protein
MTSTLDRDVRALPALVEHWVDKGLITPELAERLLADAGVPEERTGPSSLLVEAFAYLGGVVVLVASGVLVGRYWDDLALGTRLGLAATCAAVLLGVGTAVPERLGEAAPRLRSVLWALSTGAFAGFLAIAAGVRDSWSGEDAALAVAGGTSVYAYVLWRRHCAVLQHVALFAALMSTAGTAAAHLDVAESTAPGLALWGTALVWVLLSWGGLLDLPRLGYLVGAIGLIVGGLVTSEATWGLFFALATVIAVVAAAVVAADLVLLGIGAVGALNVLPGLVDRFFPGGVAGPLVLLAVGALLLVTAFRLSRRTGAEGGRRRGIPEGTPRPAVLGAVAVALVDTALLVGLHLL